MVIEPQRGRNEGIPFVQVALQTEKKYFGINYACHSRYRYRQRLFWNLFFIADADAAVLCSFEGGPHCR